MHTTTQARIPLLSFTLLLLFSGCSLNTVHPGETHTNRQQTATHTAHPVVHAKKSAFFATLKPLIEQENRRIAGLREEIMALRQLSQPDAVQQMRISTLASHYKIEPVEQVQVGFWQALLDRVDSVPVELALAQAATASDWGTARFARQGNNYFALCCCAGECSHVAQQRSDQATHELRRFASPLASVRAYMLSINSSAAYTEFRLIRHSLRVQSQPLKAESLAFGLRSYSDKGMAYVKTIRLMIRSNRTLIASI